MSESFTGLIDGPLDPLRYEAEIAGPDEVMSMVLDMIPKGVRVLDVGCGTGVISAHMANHPGNRLVGVEPHAVRAEYARKRGLEVYTEPLSDDLFTRIGKFDVVLFLDVLEHVDDPGELLHQVKSGLADEGCIIASIPNVAHWTVRADLLRGRFDYQPWGLLDVTHLRWFTEKSIHRLFNATGFTIIEQRVTSGMAVSGSWYGPWKRIRPDLRAYIIRVAARRWPRMFGFQYVIKAVGR